MFSAATYRDFMSTLIETWNQRWRLTFMLKLQACSARMTWYNSLRIIVFSSSCLGKCSAFRQLVIRAAAAIQVSFQSLALSAVSKGYQLVFCGYRVGGAWAQYTALRLHSLFRSDGAPCHPIRCITFGQPKVASNIYLKV